MRIQHIKFNGFGRWVKQDFVFQPGLNLLEAENEAGKTTLLSGICALLFGSKKEGLKVKREVDWYNQYKPWLGTDYGGEIEYELQVERFRIVRSLTLPNSKEQLLNLTLGKEITEQFLMDKKKDRRFVETQLQLTGDQFKQIAFISDRFIDNDKISQAKLIDRLKVLLTRGHDLSITGSLKWIDEHLSEIGTQKTEGKRLGKTFRQFYAMETEIKQFQVKAAEHLGYEQQLVELHTILGPITDKREKLLQEHTEITQRIADLRQLQLKHTEVNVLEFENKTLQKEIIQLESAFNERQKLQIQLKELDNISPVSNEQVYQLKQIIITKEKLLLQQEHLINQLNIYDHNFIKLTHDPILKLDENEAMNCLLSIRELVQMDKQANTVSQIDNVINYSQKLSFDQQLLIKLWIPTALISLIVFFVVSMPTSIILACLTGLLALIIHSSWLKKQKQNIFAARDLKVREEKMESLRQEVRLWLSKWGTSIGPYDPDIWEKEIRNLQSRRQKVCDRYQLILVEQKKTNEELSVLGIELADIESQLKQFTKRYGSTDLVELEKWADQTEKQIRLIQRLEHLPFVELKDLQTKRERLKELSARRGEELAFCDPALIMNLESQATELQDKVDKISAKYRIKTEEMHRLEGVLLKTGEWMETYASQVVQYERIKQELEELIQERSAWEIAKKVLIKSAQELQEAIGPQLRPYLQDWIFIVTAGRYSELLVKIEDDIQISAVVPETGEAHPINNLSKGTIKQIVIGLHLSLIQFYAAKTGIHLPIILDDAFVHFDEKRLKESLSTLALLQEKHQIIICSCQGREQELLGELGISYNKILLPNRKVVVG